MSRAMHAYCRCLFHTCSYHDDILPAVFAALHDGDDEVQNTGCFVLECFCKCVAGPQPCVLRTMRRHPHSLLGCAYPVHRDLEPEDVCKHLDELMAHLGRLVTSPNVNLREVAVKATTSVVIGSQHHFAKYAAVSSAPLICIRARQPMVPHALSPVCAASGSSRLPWG